MNPEEQDRFWSQMDRSTECWLWTASTRGDGYGQFQADGVKFAAHRLAWILTHGEPPAGLFVLHNCPGGDNRRCCNPAHLWLGTHLDNMADMVAKGRHRAGDQRGEKNGRARFSEQQILSIRHRVSNGEKQAHIAREFNVQRSTVSMIINGKNWRCLSTPEASE